MLGRCRNKTNPSFKNYGARGISVSWESFEDFWSDMGQLYKEGLTIERIDNNAGYSKVNCKWASPKENQQNKRTTKSITINGKTQTIGAWAKEFGIKRNVAYYRISKGVPPELAVTGTKKRYAKPEMVQ